MRSRSPSSTPPPSRRRRPTPPAPEIARPGDGIELSDADLAALDTSDLESLAEGESLFDTSGTDLSEGRPDMLSEPDEDGA
jgi:hypothetical protein